jgi:hypothetical protein
MVGDRVWPSGDQVVARLVGAQFELYAVRALALDNTNVVTREMAARSIHLMP